MNDVLIIAGSKSDEKIVRKAADVLDEMKVSYVVEFASAHREPDRVKELVASLDAKVIIAIAGLAAALPGFVASLTDRPVIGVPVSAALGGLDALLSIAQMPKGVPVATVGIDNGQNAAHLAARILGVQKNKESAQPRTYAEAGVDEGKVAEGLDVLAKYVRESFGSRRVTQDFGHYANTVIVNDNLAIALSTDGVGSKVIIAEMAGRYDTIGQDCVAMNVNDLICIGATPVGFVDYLACERPLSTEVLEQIGQSLLDACRASDIPILGGETAILPDIIRGHGATGLDLAGTAVGIAHPSELIDGSAIQLGDSIIGIASNGLHSNGFTLARRVLLANYTLNDLLPWGITLAEEMLKPTRVYVPHFKALIENGIDVHGIAHITGSGFRKILRLHSADFRIQDLPNIPPIFRLIQEAGKIEWTEMFSTFNMGIGLVVIVPEDQTPRALDIIRSMDEAYMIGIVEESDSGKVTVEPFGVVLE